MFILIGRLVVPTGYGGGSEQGGKVFDVMEPRALLSAVRQISLTSALNHTQICLVK